MNKRPQRLQTTSAFSLIELLMAIAVIGVMAGIALPIIQRVSRSTTDIVNRQNVALVRHTYQQAKAAGATFSSDDLPTIVDELRRGKNGSGTCAEVTFKLSIDEEAARQMIEAMPSALMTDEGIVIAPASL